MNITIEYKAILAIVSAVAFIFLVRYARDITVEFVKGTDESQKVYMVPVPERVMPDNRAHLMEKF